MPIHRSDGPGAEIVSPIQFLRWAAALCVVVSHLIARYQLRGIDPEIAPAWLSNLGSAGVLAFFAISGFIMVHTTLDRFGVPNSSWPFMVRRFLRIAPLYYLTTIGFVLFQYSTQGVSMRTGYETPGPLQMVLSFAFIPYMRDSGLIQPVYGLGWSLEYEMFFYALFAVCMMLRPKTGMLSILVVLVALVGVGSLMPVPAQSDAAAVIVYFFTRPVLLYFVLGIILALAVRRFGTFTGLPQPVVYVVASLGLVMAAATDGYLSATGIFVAVTLAAFVRPAAARRSSLPEKVAVTLGNASYSIYLTHGFLLGALAAASYPFASRGVPELVASVIVICAVCSAAGWLCWKLVEAPITRSLNKRAGLARPSIAVAP